MNDPHPHTRPDAARTLPPAPDDPDRLLLHADLDGLLPGYGLTSTRVHLQHERFPDFFAAASELRDLSARYRVIHITGGPSWFDDRSLSAANLSREALASEVRCALLLWADPELIAKIATVAPDLWSWRAGVFDFSTQVRTPVPTKIPPVRPRIDPRPLPDEADLTGAVTEIFDALAGTLGDSRHATIGSRRPTLRSSDANTAPSTRAFG